MSEKTKFEEIVEDIQNAPRAYLPVLLRECIIACIKKNVFKQGMLPTFVKNTLEGMEE